MRLHFKHTSVFAIFLACSSVHAQNALIDIAKAVEENRKKQIENGDLLTGIVVNRTMTVLGWDFFHYFAASWRESPASEHYSVSVHERPTAIRGSEIWIEYNHQRVFQTYLSPARSAVKDISAAAVDIVYQNVEAIDINRLLVQDEDLGSEELM